MDRCQTGPVEFQRNVLNRNTLACTEGYESVDDSHDLVDSFWAVQWLWLVEGDPKERGLLDVEAETTIHTIRIVPE